MKKSGKFWFFVFLFIGILLFIYFVWTLGLEAINLIYQSINFKYFAIYFLVTTFSFFPMVWRMQIILKAHKKKIGFFKLLKQVIAGYSVAYVTPSVRMGGEPLRIYMMNKECDIDVKTGSSCVVLDKFVEFGGSLIFGVVGLILVLFIPGINFYLKVMLALSILLAFSLLMFFYVRTVSRKGSFSSILQLIRIHKTKKGSNFVNSTKKVEKRMADFFHKDKKAFFLASLWYVFSGVFFIIETKFLLLSIGIEATVLEIIILITIWGLANIAPVPGGLGFLEATQSGLFYAIRGDGSIGLALSLIVRVRALFFVALGFLMISEFSGKEVWKKMKSETVEKESV